MVIKAYSIVKRRQNEMSHDVTVVGEINVYKSCTNRDSRKQLSISIEVFECAAFAKGYNVKTTAHLPPTTSPNTDSRKTETTRNGPRPGRARINASSEVVSNKCRYCRLLLILPIAISNRVFFPFLPVRRMPFIAIECADSTVGSGQAMGR